MSAQPLRVYFVATEPYIRPNPLAVAAGVFTGADAEILDKRYHPYLQDDRFVAVDDPDSADFISNSLDYLRKGVVDQAREVAGRTDRPAIWYDFSDRDDPSPFVNGVVYRPGLLASQQQPHERPVPGLAIDIADAGVPFEPIAHEPRPRVAFCGLVLPVIRRVVLKVTGKKDTTSQWLRERVLRAIRDSPAIDTDFVVRQKYHGRAVFKNPDHPYRLDFANNLAGSPYSLCVRGYGNYSVRFSETFSAGRIPLLIDTDGVLPFEDVIPYRERCVIVPIDDLQNVGRYVTEFHEKHDAASFAELQRANRATWETHFAPLAMLHLTVDRGLAEQR